MESGGNDGFGGDEISLLAEELIQLSVKTSMVEPSEKPTLICTIWIEKSYNLDSFKAQMRNIWKIKNKFEIQSVGQNVFMIVFNLEEDLETIMEGQPWLFRKSLVIFDRLTKPMERNQIRLVSSPFWIKIGPCLPEFDKKDLLHAIGVTFRGVLRSEVNGKKLQPQSSSGGVTANQETCLFDGKNNGQIPVLQKEVWAIITGTEIRKQLEGEQDRNISGKDKTDEELLQPIKKSSWMRVKPLEPMECHGVESKLQKRKLTDVDYDDYITEESRDKATKRKRCEGKKLLHEVETNMLSWNFLPTKVNMQHRKLSNITTCPRCEARAETLDHLFRECPVTIDTRVWILYSGLPGYLNNSILVKVVYSAALYGPYGEIKTEEYTKEKKSAKITGKQRWQHPHREFIKINFDGAYHESQYCSAIGIVARDAEGRVLLSYSELQKDITSAFAAEAIACWRAVQIGVDRGWQSEISKFNKVRFQHTPRSANNLAHILATETLKRKKEIYLEMEVPEYAKEQRRYDWSREPD
ncbi:hypothetical protein GOBAR_DD36352 [Gossypium barbadense]|nr:hypothetical protein GOBAR_DD36352 [Gossypium barbadense]